MSALNKFFFFKGRIALYAILKAIGITNGDEVILICKNAIIGGECCNSFNTCQCGSCRQSGKGH